MMRLARRATLLVVFSLLTLAATAHAECAWVLWNQTTHAQSSAIPGRPADVWTEWKATGHVTKKECDQDLADRTARALKSGNWEMQGDNLQTTAKEKRFTMIARLVCLPDTIDPREKGGTR